MANQQPILIKITYIHGLREVVQSEMEKYPEFAQMLRVVERNTDSVYFDFIPATGEIDEAHTETRTDKAYKAGASSEVDDSVTIVDSFLEILKKLITLKSITNIFLVQKNEKFHPIHLNNHKAILGTMIELVMHIQPKAFKTFKLRCAGSDSPEALSIQNYIGDTFKLRLSEDADLDTYIHKPGELWEVGVRVTPRPLSVRTYRVEHIKGGINPTVAYAVNTFALKNFDSHGVVSVGDLADITQTNPAENFTNQFSYLNICSGSATLLIEAGIELGNKISDGLNACRLIGFDIDNRTNSLAIQNIKKAGFIKNIQIKTADLLDYAGADFPDFGMFDAIVSDLPFGMQISKNADLTKLYKAFVEYTKTRLKPNGVFAVYTTETETFERALRGTDFNIEKSLSLQITTAVNSKIEPKIFVCRFK